MGYFVKTPFAKEELFQKMNLSCCHIFSLQIAVKSKLEEFATSGRSNSACFVKYFFITSKIEKI